jgi:heme/copper-type cytochrome/quinol oxidase subunit 2
MSEVSDSNWWWILLTVVIGVIVIGVIGFMIYKRKDKKDKVELLLE